MKSLRLFGLALSVFGIFSVVSLQAQEIKAQNSPNLREPSLDSKAPTGVLAASLPADAAPISTVQDPDAQDTDARVLVAQNQNPPRTTDGKSAPPDAPTPVVVGTSNPDDQFGKQPKRILGIIPNYRAVSANAHLPPLDFKGELWLATQDTFDYSNFIFVGVLAGFNMASKSEPAFGQGAEGFGKYYWHDFVDGAIENYMTEAIIPGATKEDPRYYTLAKGGFVKRTGYAVSRLFITRTNSGGSTFNLAEIVGSGAAAGIGNTYYPSQHNPWVKTYQRWGTQVGLDGVFNALKEFWPDIDKKIFRGKY